MNFKGSLLQLLEHKHIPPAVVLLFSYAHVNLIRGSKTLTKPKVDAPFDIVERDEARLVVSLACFDYHSNLQMLL